MLFTFPRESEMHFFLVCLPNPDLPRDKTESSLPLRESRNRNRVERALGTRVAWQPGCKLTATLEMHPLDPGQGFFPFLSDIFLPSVQWQRLRGWSCKNSGVVFALWDLWLEKEKKKKNQKTKPLCISLEFFPHIFLWLFYHDFPPLKQGPNPNTMNKLQCSRKPEIRSCILNNFCTHSPICIKLPHNI